MLPLDVAMVEKYVDETHGKGSMARLAPGISLKYKSIFDGARSSLLESQRSMSEFLKGVPSDKSYVSTCASVRLW